MKLEELGLSYEILDSVYDPDLPNGIVKQQMIEPTSVSKVKVKENRIIGLRLSKKTDLPVYIAEDPLHAVAKGTAIALKNIDRFPFLMHG